MTDTDIIRLSHKVMQIEADAVLSLKNRVDASFISAVKAIAQGKGKVLTTGIGKSGFIARKIASTFSSTGTPAVYLHPAESSHGDLGLVENNDIVIALSYGGESPEFSGILNYVARKNIVMIAITGKPNSSLGRSAKYVLNVEVSEEACPLGLAPTASSTASLAMGDALAMCVLEMKGFNSEKFAEFHPGGSLGFRLLTRVRDVMHSGQSLPVVGLETPMKEVFSIMTHKDVRGAAGVVNESGNLVGVITDGDIRRRLEKSQDPLVGSAQDLMTKSPRTIDANELAEKALFLMEQFQIQMVFVLDGQSSAPQKPVGILHIQDLLRSKVR